MAGQGSTPADGLARLRRTRFHGPLQAQTGSGSMERTPESQRNRPGRTAAADREGRTAGGGLALSDLRPASVAQAGLQRMIAAGPRMTAQRRPGSGASTSEEEVDGGLLANLRAGV